MSIKEAFDDMSAGRERQVRRQQEQQEKADDFVRKMQDFVQKVKTLDGVDRETGIMQSEVLCCDTAPWIRRQKAFRVLDDLCFGENVSLHIEYKVWDHENRIYGARAIVRIKDDYASVPDKAEKIEFRTRSGPGASL